MCLSFFKVSGLTGGRGNWLWERWASGDWDESLGEGSWVQESSQMPKEAGRLREVALLMQFPGSHSPRSSCSWARCQFPTDRPCSTLRSEEVFISVN